MDKGVILVRAIERLVALNAHHDKGLALLHKDIKREFKEELTISPPRPISIKSRAAAHAPAPQDSDPTGTPESPETPVEGDANVSNAVDPDLSSLDKD